MKPIKKINPKNVVCREEGRPNSKWRIYTIRGY
jgi:hypothetical protein